jgi:hypothetical protein
MNSFDLHYYSLNISKGEERGFLSGGLAAAAPRLANRLRKEDLIGLLLSIRGNKDADEQEIQKIALQLTQVFFQTMGSVTRAMSAVGQEINRILMDYNLDSAHEGEQLEGMLNLAVIHKGSLFICHCGPTQTYILHADSVDIFGQDLDLKTIGSNRTVQVQFYQTVLHPGNILVFSPNPPYSWSAANLSGSSYLSMEQVRRRLLNQAGDELQAVVVKVNPGQGRILIGEWGNHAAEIEKQTQVKELLPLGGSPLDELRSSNFQGVKPETEFQAGSVFNLSGGQDVEPKIDPINEPAQPSREAGLIKPAIEEDQVIPIQPGKIEQDIPEIVEKEERERPVQYSGKTWNISQVWKKLKNYSGKINESLHGIRKKIFPKLDNWQLFPPVSKVFLLLIIPLVLFAVSLTVYSRSGKEEQFTGYLDLAQQYQTLAGMSTDTFQQYDYWKKVLENVIKAEEYGSSTISSNLRLQAQNTIDSMDLTKRLEFRPALTQKLPDSVKITNVVTSGSDVYLLDKTSGSILRIAFNTKGYYELDSNFKCSPGPSGLNTIGPLIALVALPSNQPENYKVMGMDADGNLLYCVPEGTPSSQRVPSPTGGWGKIIGFALDQSSLYILDSGNNMVWMYRGSGINFVVAPAPFFDDSVLDISGAIDVAVDQEEIYILNADGHMINCQYGENKALKKTTCQDPAPYTDDRLGRVKSPWIFLDSRFISMQATHMPNSSIFILDDANRAVFQLSYQLNLEATLKMMPSRTYPIPTQAPTAFAISSSQSIFLAFNNQLYFATLSQ